MDGNNFRFVSSIDVALHTTRLHPPIKAVASSGIIHLVDGPEFMRQLQNYPALEAETRAVQLTEDLLAVPEVVATMVETMVRHNQRVEQLETKVSYLIDQQAAMQNSLQDLTEITVRGFAAMDFGFAEMREGFVGVDARADQVEARVDQAQARFVGVQTLMRGLIRFRRGSTT